MRRRPDLFVDLDGVLADFDGHYDTCFGIRPGRDKEDPPWFWDGIRAHGTFFADLPLMKDAAELWDGVKRLHPKPVILTGIPRSVLGVEAQKRAWVARHLGPDVPVIATYSKEKALHGKPGDILIDDWAKYKSLWERMGGVFILHTSAAKSLAEVAPYFSVTV